MAPTPQDLLIRAEADKRTAEREHSEAQATMRRFEADVQLRGAEQSPQTASAAEGMARRVLAAREAISKADASIATCRELIAEDATYAERSRETRPGADAPDASREVSAGDGKTTRDTAAGPVWRREDGRTATVARGTRMADSEVVAGMIARDPGRAITEQHSGIGSMVRSLSTTGSSGIVPTLWSSNIIDRARNVAQVLAAGAEIIPMDSKILQIGRLLTDPVPAWLAEGGTRTASDPSFDSVQLVSRTLSCLTVASLEFLQDAQNADQVVEEAIGKAMGLEIDRAALFSGVATGADVTASGIVASPPGPLGILGNLLANQPANVLGSGTNGTAITAATPWNELLTTYFTPVRLNEQPTAFIMNAAMQQKYAMTYDTLGQPLRPPPVLDNVPRLVSNQIPSFTQGTMTNVATDIFAGDFRQVLIGHRMDIRVQILTERYAELGQVGILATFRGDVVLARPKAMAVYRYIGGA